LLGVLIMVGCFGFNTSIVRFVSQYNVKGWANSIKALYKHTSQLTISLSLVLAAVFYLLSEWLAVAVYKNEELILPFRILALTIPFAVVATMNVEFIRGLKKVHISELFRNLWVHFITMVALVVAAYFFTINNNSPVLFYGAGMLLGAARYFSGKEYGLLKQRGEKEDAFLFKRHVIVSLPMILTSFIQFLNGKIDTIMLGYYVSTADLGVFTVAFKLSIVTNFVIGSLNTIATPKISELFWAEKYKELNKVVQSSAQLIFIFALPVTILLTIFAYPILSLVKEGFTQGTLVLQIFALTQLLNSAAGMVAIFLNMTGNQSFFTRLVAVATAVNIGLNLLLIPFFGMEGAAIATLISSAIWNIGGAYFIYKRYRIRTYLDVAYLWRKLR